jgi:hypothetical protein
MKNRRKQTAIQKKSFHFPIINFLHYDGNIPTNPGCQRGYQNLYIEEEQTTQWPKEKG